MTAPRLVLDRIRLEYSGQPLFADLSLTIPGGRTTCILGPSGCGKSTLLKLLAGAPSLEFQGEIRIEPAPAGPAVAWMSQNDLLLPWLSLLDNILLGARLRGELTPTHRDKALDLLSQAGLADQARALPTALSGGMRQRGALLRTLMEGRPVILMDEPFSALDALNRLRLQNLAARLTANATVVLVTHDPLEALRLGHHIVVLGGSPARVVRTMDLPEEPPREAGDPALARHHGELLDLLLREVA
ncbi:MAG: ABC transporter ATP-binding protein [Deltaproteobacteria bacterium]|nr:ABC transporter ATP-binding protein [Deltaproteobacteria bacterium]